MTVVALIPARGGSKGIPRKNLVRLAGKPLIAWTIEAALGAQLVSHTVVTTDDDEILETSRRLGANCPFKRPAELAADNTPALPVVQHALKTLVHEHRLRPEIVVLLQPTSPLRTSRHIDEAIRLLRSRDADSLVSVIRVPHCFNPYSIMVREGDYVTPYQPWDERQNLRQQKPEFWARNGAAIYAFRYECLTEKQSLYGDRILAYEMLPEDSIDIDTPLDLEFAAVLLRGREAGGG